MPTLICIANGNLTSSSTWGTSDATALNITGSTSVGITASYVASSTFTPGAITIDGIAVRINTRPGSSGTMTIALGLAGAEVAGTAVTINVTDIPAAGTTWVMTKFTPVLLLAATAYSVMIKASGTSLVTCFTTSGNNWLRQLRVPGTTATPAAGDNMYIFGEKTGAGAQTTRTVTMDDAAAGATIYGTMNVGAGGTLNYGTTGGIAYFMKLAGNCTVYSEGTMTMGSAAATRIPSNSSADLKFSNSSNVDFGLEILGSGVFTAGGNHNAVPWALLAADASAAATSLTTDQATGWKNGDTIAIASTTRTASQCESKALTADASGTTLTIAAITNAHAGGGVTNGSDVVAELANLTRNVRISGTSTSLQAYMRTDTATVVTLDDVEFFNMGSNTSNKRGINVKNTTGSFTANYCSFHDFVVSGSVGPFLDATGISNTVLAHCVFYNCHTNFVSASTATSGTGNSLTDCVGIFTINGNGFTFPLNITLSNIRAAGCVNDALTFSGGTFTGPMSGFVVHSGSTNGITFTTVPDMTISNLTIYRQNIAIAFGNSATNGITLNLTIDTFTIFGCNSPSIQSGNAIRSVNFINGTIRAGIVLTQTTGVQLGTSTFFSDISFVNCVFGGGGETHSTADINVSASSCLVVNFLLDNCILNSSTQVGGSGNLLDTPSSAIRANFLGATQDHKTWMRRGTWSYDTTAGMFVVSPSLRMTPASATLKLQSPSFLVGVLSGQSVTASIAVRKSVVGDGAAYNGNQPRFIVRRNYGAGITADTVLDSSTVAGDGSFETLSGVTAVVTGDCALEFFLDCDGTTGWVNVDDVSLAAA